MTSADDAQHPSRAWARVAGPQDGEALRTLCADAVASLAGRRGGAELAAALPRWRTLEPCLVDPGALESRFVFAGILSDEPVGIATGSATGDGQAVALELLYVSPRARRHGVATALYRHVGRWASVRGRARIEVSALPGDRALKAFLEAQGLRARLLVLDGPLDTTR